MNGGKANEANPLEGRRLIINDSIAVQIRWNQLLNNPKRSMRPSKKIGSSQSGALDAQLYDMAQDLGETTNLYASHPEVAARLLTQLEADVFNGRSTAGPSAKNDINQINLWKSEHRN